MEGYLIQIGGPMATGVVNFVLGLAVFRKKEWKDHSNLLFGLVFISVFLWNITLALFQFIPSGSLSYFMGLILYSSVCFIPYFFLLFVLTFPSEKINIQKKELILLTIPLGITIILTLAGFVLRDVEQTGSYKTITFGGGYFTFGLYLISYFIFAFINLTRKYLKSYGLIRTHTKFLLISIAASAIIGLTTNLILPIFGYFQFMWVGTLATVIMVLGVIWTMRRYRLFNVKVILRESQYLALVKNEDLSREEIDFLIGKKRSKRKR